MSEEKFKSKTNEELAESIADLSEQAEELGGQAQDILSQVEEIQKTLGELQAELRRRSLEVVGSDDNNSSQGGLAVAEEENTFVEQVKVDESEYRFISREEAEEMSPQEKFDDAIERGLIILPGDGDLNFSGGGDFENYSNMSPSDRLQFLIRLLEKNVVGSMISEKIPFANLEIVSERLIKFLFGDPGAKMKLPPGEYFKYFFSFRDSMERLLPELIEKEVSGVMLKDILVAMSELIAKIFFNKKGDYILYPNLQSIKKNIKCEDVDACNAFGAYFMSGRVKDLRVDLKEETIKTYLKYLKVFDLGYLFLLSSPMIVSKERGRVGYGDINFMYGDELKSYGKSEFGIDV